MVRFSGLALLALGACMPKAHIEVLQAAELTVPANIKTIAVVDHSRPGNVGETLLGSIEGALTGEALGADTRGRDAALGALHYSLGMSPRFNSVPTSVSGVSAQPTRHGAELDWSVVKAVCERSGADALIALESFDSDTDLVTSFEEDAFVDSAGKNQTETTWTVTRTTLVKTLWRLYDPATQTYLDATWLDTTDSWEAEASEKHDAIDQLPSPLDIVSDLGSDAGASYGTKIAPTWITVHRAYFGGGSDDMKHAKKLLKAQNIDEAAELWQTIADGSDPFLAAKAEFNLAVAWEARGNLRKAISHARAADKALGKGKTAKYLATLKVRRADKRRLKEQMAPVRE